LNAANPLTRNLNLKLLSKYLFILCTSYLVLCTPVFAQEKESSNIHKTRSSATIGGIKYYLHTVEKGQTLFAIAKFYGIDVNDLVIENPDAIDGIKPGQVLKIPFEKKKVTAATIDTSNYITHKVEQGQTLYSISKQYGLDAEKIKLLNPELKDGLKSGQILKIPSLKPKTQTANTVKTISEKPVGSEIPPTRTEAADRVVAPTIYKGEKKPEYNIAYFLPFHTSEAGSIDFDKLLKGDVQLPSKTTVALEFYEGALLAIDSLKKLHMNAKVFVYDIDDTDSLNIVNILKKPELPEMDLMIGPLYGSSFIPFAKFAKEHEIPIVSPFTQVNKILFNNPYVCKVSPSTTLQIEQMAKYVVDSFSTQNIILVNNGSIKEQNFYMAFKTVANKCLLEKGFAPADSVKEVLGIGGIQNAISSTKTNIVVLPSNNQSFVTDFIGKLNVMKEKYNIVLFGLSNWNGYDNLDLDYLNNLSLHIPSNSFVDYDSLHTKQFIAKYREKFKTEPENYAYQGYDVTLYFMNALQKEGESFLKNLTGNRQTCIETRFEFAQFPADSGFENRSVYILKYKDFKLVKAN
jgi:LysM repeat protein/ABC-type branched-subunit amino acid transport system substrate-binding protein